MFKKALLKASKQLYEERAKEGLIAAIHPVPDNLIQKVLSSEALSIKKSDVIVDLGCGDGRWLIAAASLFEFTCTCIGLELDSERLERSQTLISQYKSKNNTNINGIIELIQCNFLLPNFFDWKYVDIIIFFLSRDGTEKVKQTILNECLDGTRIVVIGFNFKTIHLQPIDHFKMNGLGVWIYHWHKQ